MAESPPTIWLQAQTSPQICLLEDCRTHRVQVRAALCKRAVALWCSQGAQSKIVPEYARIFGRLCSVLWVSGSWNSHLWRMYPTIPYQIRGSELR